MRRVLEDVEGGHRGIAEAMHEHGFDFAFDEVKGDEDAGESLKARRLLRSILIDRGPEEVEQRVYEERTGILDYEDRSPGDLWT